MSQLKHLLEKATQKNEMKWRVYAYDPAKDNKLVHTSKTFDDINGAGIEKAELLKKNPDYTIEIIAESADIDVKNPGVLEVPDGKKVDELPQSHFEKLVDKKGYAEVIRALTNLEVWNKDKNKSLSSWASNMADKLKKKFRPESAQKSESKVNMPKLKNEIQAAVNKYFKNDKDLLEYVYIDTKKDKFGRDVLEVRAELGYNGMVKLAEYLDKIVTKYDKYAYFDQETSGIMTAVFESAQKNESLRDLNLELADDTNAITASADKIRQRFEYRTLQNQSYDEKQAEKLYLEVRRELEKAKKLIDACYNKIG